MKMKTKQLITLKKEVCIPFNETEDLETPQHLGLLFKNII